MRRQGSALRIKEIENLLLSGGNGVRVKATSGKRGDYAGMGGAEASQLYTRKLRAFLPAHIKLTYDERLGEGVISIMDDDVGQLCRGVPGLLEMLGGLTDVGDNDKSNNSKKRAGGQL